ncbi:MAG: Gfo/Idh/MocA family oxidoreductase [Armatimonadetes bacterium]|nr:Gfo/Idh/MocA family oxidoreductase [Armatimonadota bacterium]
MARYRAVIVGAGRMAGTIDDEVVDYAACIRPYSHAAGYAEVPEVKLVAFADPDIAKARALQGRYGVPRVYDDYREMIAAEHPDIVSVTTPATLHAEIVIFAAEHGARAIYCEKALCCSLAEADAMVAAVEGHGVKFNTGTLRRWHPGMEQVRRMVEDGTLGHLNSVITYSVGSVLHSASHFFDLMLYWAGDPDVEWVQGTVTSPGFDPHAARWEEDVDATGIVQFANGVRAYLLSTAVWAEFAAIGTRCVVEVRNNGMEFQLRCRGNVGGYEEYLPAEFPPYERVSPTVRLIDDLVHALDTGGETRQGIRTAVKAEEIAFALIESHRQNGARVNVPLSQRDFWMHSH